MPISGKEFMEMDDVSFRKWLRELKKGGPRCCICRKSIDVSDPGETHIVKKAPKRRGWKKK